MCKIRLGEALISIVLRVNFFVKGIKRMVKSLNFLKKEKGRKNMIYSCYPIIFSREIRK